MCLAVFIFHTNTDSIGSVYWRIEILLCVFFSMYSWCSTLKAVSARCPLDPHPWPVRCDRNEFTFHWQPDNTHSHVLLSLCGGWWGVTCVVLVWQTLHFSSPNCSGHFSSIPVACWGLSVGKPAANMRTLVLNVSPALTWKRGSWGDTWAGR